jgi:hypothetical protein
LHKTTVLAERLPRNQSLCFQQTPGPFQVLPRAEEKPHFESLLVYRRPAPLTLAWRETPDVAAFQEELRQIIRSRVRFRRGLTPDVFEKGPAYLAAAACFAYPLQDVATVTFGDFEWDADKAADNAAKHGVTFEEATTVFLDLEYLLIRDATEAERFVAMGMSGQARILFVVHCERGERIRIISARRATRREREIYERRRDTD